MGFLIGGFLLLVFIGWGICVVQYYKLNENHKELLKNYKELRGNYAVIELENRKLQIIIPSLEDRIKEIKKMNIKDFVIWRGSK